MLILHISVALAGLILAGAGVIWPSSSKIRLTYALIAGTFISGGFIVVRQHADLTTSCLSGLFYLAASLPATKIARFRLARQEINK